MRTLCIDQAQWKEISEHNEYQSFIESLLFSQLNSVRVINNIKLDIYYKHHKMGYYY